MSKTKKKDPVKKGFKTFLSKFPKAGLPLTLKPGDQNAYSRKNKPLSPEMAFDFIWQEGDLPFTDYTEFVPCFRLPDTAGYYLLIYWQGDMLDYHFDLAVFDKKGEILQKTRIAGTKVEGELLELTVAEIKTSWDIEIRSGTESVQQTDLSKAVYHLTGNLSIDPSSGQLTIF